MVCMYVKSGLIAGMKAGIFGRNKTLASAEVCTKLHVSTCTPIGHQSERSLVVREVCVNLPFCCERSVGCLVVKP